MFINIAVSPNTDFIGSNFTHTMGYPVAIDSIKETEKFSHEDANKEIVVKFFYFYKFH